MKEKDKPPVFIKLTPLQVKKIEVMKKSIQEPVTRKDIINGLIESAYVVALNTLYDEGLLSKKTYEDGLKLVPDYLKGDI
jgi:dihydroorotate dehydrogenase